MKRIKKLLLVLGVVVLGLLTWVQLSGNTHIYRTLAMTIFRGQMGPQIDELNDFPTRSIPNAKPEPWPHSFAYNNVQLNPELIKKLHENKTTAYLLIQNDSIVYEDYWEGANAKTESNSFSMAKSITAALIGCALKEGLIKSLDEKVGTYIEAFQKEPYTQISIRHLLMMSSGLDFKETYGSILGWPAKAYYGKDVNATVMDAPKLYEPGTVYEYKGGDSQLLGMILEKASGKRASEYASQHLWQKIGAEDTAYWSLDVPNGMEKVSCCYYASAHDFARLGKLYMQFGNWNGMQLIDSSFIAHSIIAAPTLTASGKPNTQYGYQWWILNYKGLDVFYARGIKGQYIFNIPAKKMIIVRLGHKRAEKNADDLPLDIFDYLELGLSLGK
ncbi:MAG: serine hydrolase [Bacteroidota bacterium]|nr:serine hydrolase [Bacteroidota bacterium]